MELLNDPWFWVPIAFWVGWKVSELFQVAAFKELLNDLNVKQKDLQSLHNRLSAAAQDDNNDLPVLEVKVEQHPEGLFAYRKSDGFFIAQGKDRDTLMENLVNNLTNVRVVVAKEDGADLISS